MSALDAVERLRERREQRNARNPGLAYRSGSGAFLDPAEEAAIRLSQHEADLALVERELKRRDNYEVELAKKRKAAIPALAEATANYREAQKKMASFYPFFDALRECAEARKVYDREWFNADKLGIEVEQRIDYTHLARPLNEALRNAEAC